jgi:hypothetical protein
MAAAYLLNNCTYTGIYSAVNSMLTDLILTAADDASTWQFKFELFQIDMGLSKTANDFVDIRNTNSNAIRNERNDRVFPLDTVELVNFKSGHNNKIENVFIHTGPSAHQLALLINAVAIVFGKDIFFRDNTFNTATEEGRKTLAHELTHVAQFEDGKINSNADKDELEAEAEGAERAIDKDMNQEIPVSAGNNIFLIQRQDYEKLIDLTVTKILETVENKKHILPEKEYFVFLCKYEKFLKGY